MRTKIRIVLAASVPLVLAAGCSGGSGSRNAGTTTGAVSGPARVVSADFDDVNGDGALTPGDNIVVKFDRPIVLGTGPNAPTAADFRLPVNGDALGAGASVGAGVNPDEVNITIGTSPVLTIDGTFLPALIAPGSPSGIDLSLTLSPGAIQDTTGADAKSAGPVDIAGTAAPPPPPPPPPGPTVLSADYTDTNGTGVVDQGDTVIVRFSADITVGFGANAPVPADFDLPVSGDSLGAGPLFSAGANPDELEITLGTSPTLTPDGTFSPTSTSAGDPTGIDIASGIGAGHIVGAVGGSDAQPGTGVDLGGTVPPPTGPTVVSALFEDADSSGFIDAGDTVTVTFSAPIQLGTGSNAPVGPDFFLPVSNDGFEILAQVTRHPTNTDQVVITFTQGGSVFEPNGTFDPGVTAAGSASGIDVSPQLPPGIIMDTQGRTARASTPVDIGGFINRPTPPVMVSSTFIDVDLSGDATEGDRLVLEFDQGVFAKGATPASIGLPVSGDTLGAGATLFPGDRATEVSVTLGTSPILTPAGTFDAANLGAGAASGIDVAATIPSGEITNRFNMDAVPAPTPVDVAVPGIVVSEPFADNANEDTAATSAEWNLAGSGKLEGSLTAFDVGSGTDPLVISANTTIDTDNGTIGGQTTPGFRGAGVFEFSSIEVQKGAQVAVTGRAPLILKATGDATIEGSLILDGEAGSDQTAFSAPGAPGGRGGPGGFDGGDGADGGLLPAGDGQGPAGGGGGQSEDLPGGGAGGGFGTAGEDGDGQIGAGGIGGPAIAFDGITVMGGSGGGGGGGDDDAPLGSVSSGDEGGAGGGGGGGAVRIVAGGTARIAGVISANGGMGGEGTFTGGAAGGGGAGGLILIQAAGDVVITSSAVLSALGGEGNTGDADSGAGGDGVILVETANGQVTQLPPAITGLVFPPTSEGLSANVAFGAGTEPFEINASSVVNTDAGTVDGVPHPGFRGNGTFEVSSLRVAQGATLRAEGTVPLRFQVAGGVNIFGAIDLDGEDGRDASGNFGGQGGRGVAGGAAGGNGGSIVLNGTTVTQSIEATSGQGAGGGVGAINNTSNAGGGGGSFGSSGTAGLGVTAAVGAAGPVYGVEDLTTLDAGSGGGGGNADTLTDTGGGGGGGAGGGAIEILAGGEVLITGAITAKGGNGGESQRGADGGGGSGGAIRIVSALRIAVTGTVTAPGGDGRADGGQGGHGRVRFEDSTGSFAVGRIEPAIATGTFSTSVGTSLWIRVTDATAQPVTDPTFLALVGDIAIPAGTAAIIEAQGADEDASGQPDLGTVTPFTTDATALTGKEFVRFRVSFKSDTAAGDRPSAEAIGLIGR